MANTDTNSLKLPTALDPGGGAPSATTGTAASATAGSNSNSSRKSPLENLVHTHRLRGSPSTAGGGGAHEQNNDGGDDEEDEEDEDEDNVKPDKWWKIHLFRGMINDIRRRAPYYWSDFADAWDYRVVPATVYMYFANIMPALAFSLDMFTKTDMQYGVNEVLLASVLGAVVFSLLACQPLVIVGVTGPITVFNYTVYDIMNPTGTNYLAFMCWIGIWSLIFHWILAITNSCNWLKYVTRFPCDIFGFYVACIYLQKGIQVLERFGNDSPFYLSVAVALLVFMIAYACGELGGASPLFWHPVRVFLKDYGTPLTVIFFTGFVHFGRMNEIELEKLPTSKSFFPTADRGWFIHFWDIPVSDVFLAIPFAILLTILFWFDHNVSSLIAQGTEFPLRKPAGFHWDLFLLGLTTGVAGLLGLPFPNGLIPQAPFHTESLCVTVAVTDTDEAGEEKGHYSYKPTHVVEQRVSNLAQGLLTLGTMSGPLLVVLHLIPQAVLAGLFFIMGYQALEGNGITAKILFLCRDKALTPPSHPLRRIRRRAAVWWFVALELVGFGATFAITQTVAAIGFPVFILALIPVRALLLPRLFTPEELGLLDGPTASPFTLESVGGSYGHSEHQQPQDEGVTSSSSDGTGRARAGEAVFGSRKSAEDRAERGRAGPETSREKSNDVEMARVPTNTSTVSRRTQPGRSGGE
ncbi:transporter [Pestalotiopsis fici W106-1]|uniref:Transporter n=1 Tax=Pestalotiopsis fici (strain W106-1 / CGMCC3.15140) TaxID=1229662 RepID=W3WVW0_PESFW|nr:transporter [Pestalotiopsis fici W106-1]ETS76991.1 transporter [Pestalotiopsis fici W106-1]